MSTRIVDVQDAQAHFAELLASIRPGTEVILTKDNTPVAKIVPLTSSRMPRIAGLGEGSIWMSEDFDEPLPDTFWTGEA